MIGVSFEIPSTGPIAIATSNMRLSVGMSPSPANVKQFGRGVQGDTVANSIPSHLI